MIIVIMDLEKGFDRVVYEERLPQNTVPPSSIDQCVPFRSAGGFFTRFDGRFENCSRLVKTLRSIANMERSTDALV